MTYLAAVDVPSWGGLLISALVALCGGLWFLFTQIKGGGGSGGDALVGVLQNRIDDLERDLDSERRAREQLSEELATMRTELAVTKAQLLEAYRRMSDRP